MQGVFKVSREDAPNFFIIGATKAGTTALYSYLKKHPDIYLSDVKEPQYFCNDELYNRGLEFYLDTFFRGSKKYKARGEATPHYLYYEKSARRIAETFPGDNVGLIVILRDPVQRAYSLYWNMVNEGVEDLAFEDAIAAERRRMHDRGMDPAGSIQYQYIDSGMYARQIKMYQGYFDRRQIYIMFLQDMVGEPDRAISGVCEFIGVQGFSNSEAKKILNEAGRPRSRVLHNLIRNPYGLKRIAGKMLSERMKYRLANAVLRMNWRPYKYPTMNGETERRLREVFKEDVLELQEITGRDLTSWLPKVDRRVRARVLRK